ncbi:MAG: hypothetical protein NTX81_09740 [Candidatus Bathyarchaeota archaeon]|nr:hypothetical protein [Candidatus Bathyarchaeota archaeon]
MALLLLGALAGGALGGFGGWALGGLTGAALGGLAGGAVGGLLGATAYNYPRQYPAYVFPYLPSRYHFQPYFFAYPTVTYFRPPVIGYW